MDWHTYPGCIPASPLMHAGIGSSPNPHSLDPI
uniref:Uncharacterized protein n=1 Tax=Anguilla anguilla TaxID=7936 RepID=A0A0E9TPE2_ANGAN